MAKLKSFKEVLEIAITKDTVKVITILDEQLSVQVKDMFIFTVTDLISDRANNVQMEIEFEDLPGQSLCEKINHSSHIMETDARFCAHI